MINIPSGIKELLILCSKNIKGLTKKEELENILPIKHSEINVRIEDKKMIISKNNKILGHVWEEFGCYDNLKILKIITKQYNVEPKGERILQLMKYKYIIDNYLIGEG